MSDSPREVQGNPVVRDNQVVSLSYVLRDNEGDLLDSADADSPLEYIQGYGQIIPGLENELYGMAIDDEKDVVVDPENAYGIYDPEANQIAPLDMFPEGMDLEIGLPVDVYDEETDEPSEAFVAEIYDDGVLLDFNHPLAGETLHFHVKVVGLRDASPSEISHGHVHGEGHDHHH